MKKYTHVIWDFNGTVLNDVQAGIDSINAMLAPRGLPTLDSVEAYRAAFGFPVEEYYRRLGFDFAKEDFKTCLAPLWVSLYQQNSRRSRLYEGVELLSQSLRKKGILQSILSASERTMLREQLRTRGALDWFDEIWGTDSIHAYGKERLAAAWRAAHPDATAVVLGDTTHDFTVAHEIGADCILVAAGHHSYERLASCGTAVVRDLKECACLLMPEEHLYI